MNRYAFILFACALCCQANVLRVPAEYVSIQSALNATDVGDTVLVAMGVYAESITTPGRSFWLIGDVDADTGFFERPVIDPTSLPEPRLQRCGTIRAGGLAVIERMAFRNGPEMFPRANESLPGGLENNNWGATFRDCLFDSTYMGIHSGVSTLILERTHFHKNLRNCLRTGNVRVTAHDCSFNLTALGVWAMATGGSGTEYVRCSFTGDTVESSVLFLNGNDVTVTDCIFGPIGFAEEQMIYLGAWNCLIENNVFTDCVHHMSVITSNNTCEHPLYVRGNVFDRMRSSPTSANGACMSLSAQDDPDDSCYATTVEYNVFHDCSSASSASAIFATGTILARRNRFTRMRPDSMPVINRGNWGCTIHDNVFQDNGFAIYTEWSGNSIDARFNWWGDSSGPFHYWNNPNGHGDEVGDGVQFSPWRTDTAFFYDEVSERPPVPDESRMEVFPNPFNAIATIYLTIPSAMVVKIELFDLLGRHVKEIWSGAMSETREFVIDGHELSSGIYYARAFDVIGNRPLAVRKLALVK